MSNARTMRKATTMRNASTVAVIGASGHIGSFLIPRLVKAGHKVIALSRGATRPYVADEAWQAVDERIVDRVVLEERGEFGTYVAALEADIVVDLICFTPESADQLLQAIDGKVRHLIHCGSIWVHGANTGVAHTEECAHKPLGDYGRNKSLIQHQLLPASNAHTSVSILHPGHLVGPGWVPLNPAGHFDPQLFADFEAGHDIVLPGDGSHTLHHVHADDVARAFIALIDNRAVVAGHCFNIVSDQALSLRQYAQALSAHFASASQVSFLPFDEWRAHQSTGNAEVSWEHLSHNSLASNAKLKNILGFSPQYSSMDAIIDSIA